MDHKMSRSPWVIHYDGSSCNGCDIEVLASLTPLFDAERFGVVNTGTPKHADIFLVTGSVNAQNLPVVRQIYIQMLEPKCGVAGGICACSGGVFRDAYNVIGGVDRAIPVDVYAPGCAIRPETVIDADFMKRATYALGQQTRQGLPILVKSGYFYDRDGSPLAPTDKAGSCHRWWTKRIEFNRWMKKALSGTRISRSNYVCGGLVALPARAFTRVAFDPFITRGEDLDYLFNMRMFGYDVWFDNEWTVRHLPPESEKRSPRFMQDVYRWYYERAKLTFAAHQKELVPVTAASLMPYPGPWISRELDDRVHKTAMVRSVFTREHEGYLRIWRHGLDEAKAYARQTAASYLRFQSFWPKIMDELWRDAQLISILEGAE